MKKIMYVLAIMATVAFVSCNKGDNKAEGENQDSTQVENAEKKCCGEKEGKCCKAEEISRAEAAVRAFEAACETGDEEALMRINEEYADVDEEDFTEDQVARIQAAAMKFAMAAHDEYELEGEEGDFE